MQDTARVSASYSITTEAQSIRMDATGRGLGAAYGMKFCGVTNDLGLNTRTLEFETSSNRGERARFDLEELGFAATMMVVA